MNVSEQLLTEERIGQDVVRPGSRDAVPGPDAGRRPVSNVARELRDQVNSVARESRDQVSNVARDPRRQISNEARLIRGAFRAAGLAVGTAVRGGQWAVDTTVEATRQIAQAAMEGESSAELAERTGAALQSLARGVLGVREGDRPREVVRYVPTGNAAGDPTNGSSVRSDSLVDLRRRGDALLARSADVYFSEEVHPAYDRILDQLAPDEARILRFMALSGPQPVLDVRTSRPLGIGAEVISRDLTSVPGQAGVRHPERARIYIINLQRLGLLHISDEPVLASRYMVLEVQPSVEAALRRAGRAPKVVRKSLRLTEFGEDFCRACFTIGTL